MSPELKQTRESTTTSVAAVNEEIWIRPSTKCPELPSKSNFLLPLKLRAGATPEARFSWQIIDALEEQSASLWVFADGAVSECQHRTTPANHTRMGRCGCENSRLRFIRSTVLRENRPGG